MTKLIPPVVRAGTMANSTQADIVIDDELLLRAWRESDAATVVEAFSDVDIQHWHFRSYETEEAALNGGVATRACIAATRWAHDLGLHRIQLQHSTRNEASGRVAVRAGFVPEGVRRGANLHDDGWHDMRLYSHLATDGG